MRNRYVSLWGVAWCLWLSFPAAQWVSADEQGPTARRVLIISADGLRPDAIEPAGATVMLRLIRTGSYQATAMAELPPVTLPNHTSMVTGLSIVNHGVFANVDLPGRVKKKTIFDVAKEAELCVGFFFNKGKLGYLCEDHSVDVWRKTTEVAWLADEVVAAIESTDMDLMFVHFGDPDGTGHRSGWMSEEYFQAVRGVDAAIDRILDTLTAKGQLAETVVIVTADHGGHKRSHYRDTDNDRHIPFIINGPGIAAGRLLHEQLRPMDVAATALDLLGLPLASAEDGNPAREAYVGFVQEDNPPPAQPSDVAWGYIVPFFALPVLLYAVWRARRGRRGGASA